jgi:hypothetical protein
MPRKRRTLQDQEDAEQAKEVGLDALNGRDEHILDQLRKETFCLALLPPIGPPPAAPLDFTIFVTKLDDCPNLVVAAPQWTLEGVCGLFNRLPRRQFAHGKTAQVIESFVPIADNWFRFETEIVYVAGVAFEPPYHRAGDGGRWAHCADLRILSGETESRLRVIHVGLGPGRDPVFLHFLAPHGLVPKKLLL